MAGGAVWLAGCSLRGRRTVKEAVILKISIFEWTRETRILLEGKLAHAWALEAQRAWESARGARNRKHIVIDLCAVSFVDRAGEQFLEKACAAGAILIGADPMIRTLIEEIKSRALKEDEPKKPVGLFTVVILSLLAATLVVGCSLVY